MLKVNFQDGTKVSSAKVTIDEVDYPVTPARYNGATPLSSTVMNTMQDNIEDAIDQNVNNIGGKDYDATSTYDVGDIVKYQGQLYICTTAITTAEAWNNNHWQATDVLSSAGGNEIAIGSASDITGKTKIFVEESTQRLKYKDSTTGQFEDIAGDEVFIGDEEDAPDSTKIIVDTEDDSWNNIGTEVVDTLSGNEANRAPSVRAVNEISNVQVLQLNLVPNEEYIDSNNFLTWGIRIGKLVYITVEFGWKKVFTNSDNTTVFISGFPTNLITSAYVYPTDTISGHRYRMHIREGNLLNWWASTNGINYGDSANKVQRLEILGYLQK